MSGRAIYFYYLPSNTNITLALEIAPEDEDIDMWAFLFSGALAASFGECSSLGSVRLCERQGYIKWFKRICWEANQTLTLHVGCQFLRWFPKVYLCWNDSLISAEGWVGWRYQFTTNSTIDELQGSRIITLWMKSGGCDSPPRMAIVLYAWRLLVSLKQRTCEQWKKHWWFRVDRGWQLPRTDQYNGK